MSLIKEKSNFSNLTRYYKKDNLSTISESIRWLSGLRTIKDISISNFLLSDLLNRSDEGSDNAQLSGDATVAEIEKAVKEKSVDMISAYGTFEGKPIVAGININNYEAFITIRKNKKANIDLLEKELGLN